jgi:hypothetical protein
MVATPAGETRRRGVFRRHKAITVLVTLSLVLAGTAFGWALYLNHELGQVPKFDSDLDRSGAPPGWPGMR